MLVDLLPPDVKRAMLNLGVTRAQFKRTYTCPTGGVLVLDPADEYINAGTNQQDLLYRVGLTAVALTGGFGNCTGKLKCVPENGHSLKEYVEEGYKMVTGTLVDWTLSPDATFPTPTITTQGYWSFAQGPTFTPMAKVYLAGGVAYIYPHDLVAVQDAGHFVWHLTRLKAK